MHADAPCFVRRGAHRYSMDYEIYIKDERGHTTTSTMTDVLELNMVMKRPNHCEDLYSGNYMGQPATQPASTKEGLRQNGAPHAPAKRAREA